MNRLSTAERVPVIQALVEGNSIRATCRMTGRDKGTVSQLLADLGAEVVEKHFTLSRDDYGPDAAIGLEPEELHAFVREIRELETMLASPVDKADVEPPAALKRVFEKSVVAAGPIPAGTTLEARMLAAKKPGTGIPTARLPELVGRRARKDIAADTLLTEADLE